MLGMMENESKKATVEADLPEALSVLRDIKKSSGECLQHLRALISKVKEKPPNVQTQGLSFLDVKNQLMGSYMANLGLLMDKKTSGQSVGEDPSIDRLVEIRTVLEKMRPIEHKLKYQINKVVTSYKEGKHDPSDPRKFKPNFGAFANMPNNDSSDEDEKESEEKSSKSKVYVAPKLAPVHYSDDETTEDRQKKLQEKKTKRALSSAMLREMREQYTDAPTEIVESRDLHRMRDSRKIREKTEYEETNFVRLSVTKKDAAGMRKLGTMSALGTLADFDDLGALDGNPQDGPSNKKRKISKKHKGKSFGKKKGGKRHRR